VPKARLGVALLLPPPVADEVDGLRRAVGDGALGRIPPHLTLVPPVNVRADRMDHALAVLRAAAAATRPFNVELGPPATFLPVNPVLYLPVSGSDGLAVIHELRDRVFTEPLARTLTHPFVPHVTLADEAPPDRINAALASMADYRRTVVFDRVHLLEEGDGRQWTPIADAAFEAASVVGRGGLPLTIERSSTVDPQTAEWAAAEWDAFNLAWHGEHQRMTPLVLTARRDGRVVGLAEGEVDSAATGFLRGLIVDQQVRGEGVGSQLLAAFLSAVADMGGTRCTLHTEKDGPSEDWYRQRGWVTEVEMPKYRHGRDFVRFTRNLGT
jgi:2'-5' RNA ligase